MKRLIFILLLLFAVLPSALAADPVTDKVFAITHYAEQYEMGQISYAQLRVYSGAIREDVRELMSEQVFGSGTEKYTGVSEDAAKKFFGAPTEYTNWVWSSNEEKDVKIDNKMPRWEQIVYDGKKIQVSFNAWPNIYQGDGEEKYYYWVDFNIRFKNNYNFDIGSMQSELTGLAKSFLEKRSDIKEFAGKLVEYSTLLQNYISQNKENCGQMLQKFFSSEDKSMEQEYINWETELYSGDRLTITAFTKVCDSCEWFYGDTWFEPRYEGPGFEKFEVRGGGGGGNYNLEDLKQKTTSELLGLLREEFGKAKKVADSAEKEGGFHISDIEANIRLINRAISETTNNDPSLKSQVKSEYISAIDSIMGQYKTEKSTQKELRYEKRLLEDFAEKTNKQCRQVQEEECAIDEGCIEGSCKIAIGGDEDCRNKADDDGDTLIDCRDPDCARSCGKLCKSKCEGECWPCMQQCNSACKECDECRNDGEGGEQCNDICSNECDPCRNEKCWETSKCTDCRVCEDANREIKEGECDMACKPCVACTGAGANETCEDACKPCNECKSPTINPECVDKCKKITEEYTGGLFAQCEDMCKKGVIFYCSGSKQYSPCDDTTYICSGNIQPIPCELFTCKNEDGGERIQTVTCDQQALCGQNQVADGDKCRCRAGFFDCDKDGVNCESETMCGTEAEVCDDRQDNDNDYMIDCEDLMDCRLGTPCDIGKICFDGKCLLQEDANVSARCGENEAYIDGMCNCIEGYAMWGGKCVPLVINLTCDEGFILVGSACLPKQTECLEGFELKDGVCVQITVPIEPNATECLEGFELKDGICTAIITKCPSGYKLENNGCVPEIMVECPSGYKLENDGCKFIGEAVECTDDEVFEAGKCISKDLFKDNEIRPIETGKTCALAEDCGSEREVCSNGFCKEIPEDVYEREYGEHEDIQIPKFEDKIREEAKEEKTEDDKEQDKEILEEKIKEEAKEEKNEEGSMKEEITAEPEPESSGEPVQSESMTGAFFKKITGLASKEEKCSSDDECNPNQHCDKFMDRCYCKEGRVDCNGKGDGSDDDGCESEDITCGGQREICGGGCKENQVCNESKGWCECTPGFNDCDGNWMNGCESNKMCISCKTDDDCSQPVCAEWDNVLLNFACVEGEAWKEENGVLAFSGGCNSRPTGRVDPYLSFDAWGTAFQDVDTMRRGLESEQFGGWCKFEYESKLKQRKEIENGLNTEFLKWFFDEYIVSEPEQWENRISGIYDTYWAVVDNARETARTSACLGEKFPEYAPIDIEYESSFGKVHIWEEWNTVQEFENIRVLTPYMEIWIFPSKEILKAEIIKARENGYMPGPPEQRLQEIGPSMKEKEEVKRNPEALKEIEDIAKDFGGSLDGLVTVVDGKEDLFYLKIAVNPDVIFKGRPVKTIDFEPDVKVTVQLDFLYDIIKKTEQHGEIESPPWDSRRRVRNMLSNALDKGMIVAKITGALATGDIKVEPLSAVPKVLKVISMAAEGEEKKP